MKINRIITASIALAMGCSVCACSSGDSQKNNSSKASIQQTNSNKTIGISMPAMSLERWNNDGQFLKTQFENAGYNVDLRFSENDAMQQNKDVSEMINNKVDLLLIAAVDSTSLSQTLKNAKDVNIPVVSYDRLIMNSDVVTYYVSFDNYTVGKLQGEFVRDQLDLDNAKEPYTIEFVAGDAADNNARYFFKGAYEALESYIDDGKLIITSGNDEFEKVATEGWTTANAKKNMHDTIMAYYSSSTRLDVVLCANDSTALGVSQAIEEDYKGGNQPIITGQDGDIENLKNIVDGKQSMTVYKNVNDEAGVAYEVSKTILAGNYPAADLLSKLNAETVYDTSSYNNGAKYIQSFLLVPTVITKDNLDALVKTGIYQWDADKKYLELVSK